MIWRLRFDVDLICDLVLVSCFFGLVMTVRDAVSRCSCTVGFFLLVVPPLILLCSSLRFRGLFYLLLRRRFSLFFIASLVSFDLLLCVLVLLRVVAPLNSFRLSL